MQRRPYKDGVSLSLVGCGGIVLMGMEQSAADRLVSESIDRGVNYFDVAPSYGEGEAETKLGLALRPHRGRVFLACKTIKRHAGGAREELEQSLTRLHTDHLDLYQFHAVTTLDEVDEIFEPGGAAEAVYQARKEGKVRFIGFSAHSEAAARAFMDRAAIDSILFPFNAVCFARDGFGPDILRRAERQGIARLGLKAMALSAWKDQQRRGASKCWYQPIEDEPTARLALRFTLSQNITAVLPPGDERWYRVALDEASRFTPLSEEEREELFAELQGITPLFPLP